MVKLIKIPETVNYKELAMKIKKQRKKYKDVHIKSKGLDRYIECVGEIN